MKKKIFLMLVITSVYSFTLLSQNKYEKRANPDNYSAPVMKAITYGLTAPSPHNTQSWYIDTISSTEMLLYVKHQLPKTDPPSRQIHIGAGCFIELVSIGMSNEGYETQVQYFPQGDYTLNAYEMAQKPVARIKLVKNASTVKDNLYDYIYERGTNRGPYTGEMITPNEFSEMKNLMGKAECELIYISGTNEMKPYLDIFSKAMEIETRTNATNEETRYMFRFNENERSTKKDGISIPQMGYSGFIIKMAEKSLKNGDSITWHSEKNSKATMKGINKGIYSSKGIILFKTKSNTPLDWVLAGRDYARFNVAIAKIGIVTHPYNQVIQEYNEMDELQNQFTTLSKINHPEKIQMIVRIGRARSTYKSWRKMPEDYLIK